MSGSDGACKLALARGKTAVTRVGGGQGNDDMYRSVINFNYAEPRKKHYHVLGGSEGMIGGGGGYLMGKFYFEMSMFCYILIISYVNTCQLYRSYQVEDWAGEKRELTAVPLIKCLNWKFLGIRVRGGIRPPRLRRPRARKRPHVASTSSPHLRT